jgi:hypothetical protein
LGYADLHNLLPFSSVAYAISAIYHGSCSAVKPQEIYASDVGATRCQSAADPAVDGANADAPGIRVLVFDMENL